MTEATQVNAAIRTHLGPLGRFQRVEHAIEVGWPDWRYLCRGVQGWIEAKLIPRSGRCPETFTLDQLRWGEEEVRWGGAWFLLGLRAPRTWVLYDAMGARGWFDRRSNAEPLLEVAGPFPRDAVLHLLTRHYGDPSGVANYRGGPRPPTGVGGRAPPALASSATLPER